MTRITVMKISEYFARKTGEDTGNIRWQLLSDHLRETADIAERFCITFPWSKWAYTEGLWHDLGKYTEAFQRRLNGSNERAIHSTSGAKAAVDIFTHDGEHGKIIGRILAYGIAGHHAGLPDGDSANESCLDYRLRKEPSPASVSPESILLKPELSIRDVEGILRDRSNQKDFSFGLAFFVRMLFSCLVDADRLNSVAFAEPDKSRLRKQYPSIQELHDRFFLKLEHLSGKDPERAINRHRASILSQCLAAAERPSGIFSLTVPTGGGKTLSSLAFALKHALKHDLERIIYVIPYTSIIEQNARVFREFLGEDAVVEHHSNFEYKEDGDKEDPERIQLATENWDAPLIVTTNVQFFESLFSHKSSRCRKLHNLMRSVVILDEAQMLPPDLLLPCVAAVRELATRYKTTAVLCTATQPALNREDGFPDGLEGVHEIIADRESLYRSLQRTEIKVIGKREEEEIAELFGERKQALCIVNTRARARRIYDLCVKQGDTYHLSAMMYPEHRTQALLEIRKKLDNGYPCRVISTQLIEAGVDIDFPVVFRELAGVDSIAQAAGRCNREGKLSSRGEVYVFETPEGAPSIFRQQAQTALTVIRHHGDDVLSLEGIREYFRELYWTKGAERLDLHGILNLMTPGCEKVNFPFREIGEKFRLIAEDTIPVLIPLGKEGSGIAGTIRAGIQSRAVFRKAQRYVVSVYRPVFSKLWAVGAVEMVHESMAILNNMSLYSDHVGLMLDNPQYRDPVSNIT